MVNLVEIYKDGNGDLDPLSNEEDHDDDPYFMELLNVEEDVILDHQTFFSVKVVEHEITQSPISTLRKFFSCLCETCC